MDRCALKDADFVLDGAPWRLAGLAALVLLRRRLWGRRGVQWLAYPRTVLRLFAAAPAQEQAWLLARVWRFTDPLSTQRGVKDERLDPAPLQRGTLRKWYARTRRREWGAA